MKRFQWFGRFLEMKAGHDFPVMQAERGLDDPGYSRARLQMADVGLYRPDKAVAVFHPPPASDHLCDRRQFDRVAYPRPRSVSLEVLDALRGDCRPCVSLLKHQFLRGLAGYGDAVGAAILVHGRTSHQGVNRIVIGQRLSQRFQQNHASPFGAHEAIGPHVEGSAPTGRGEHGSLAERDRGLRPDQDVHTARQGQGALSAPKALAGQVDGDQRR